MCLKPGAARPGENADTHSMDPNLGEWLNLAVRWLHVITGIAWIGSSFYFNWQDSHLHPPEVAREGVDGELWMVHGGGFYRAGYLAS